MHSFTPSLSFLLFAFLLPAPFDLFGSSALFARAAGMSPALPIELAARDLGHGAHIAASHRRRGAELGHAISARAGTDLILYPGRRAAGASFTNFVTGLGACGGYNVASDFVVALDMQQFDSGSYCGAAITITANGKTAHATIVDRCVNCGYNNLDLTLGLYAFFDPTMNGRISGDWEFGSGAPATTVHKPTPTPTPSPAPTTTSTRRTTATTSITTSAATLVASSTAVSTTATSAAAVATTPAVVAGNIEATFEAFLGMGSIVMGALGSST